MAEHSRSLAVLLVAAEAREAVLQATVVGAGLVEVHLRGEYPVKDRKNMTATGIKTLYFPLLIHDNAAVPDIVG